MRKRLRFNIKKHWKRLKSWAGLESKLRHKLFLMLFVMLSIPFMFFSYLAIHKTSNYLFLEAKQESQYLSVRLQHFVDHYFIALFINTQELFQDFLVEHPSATIFNHKNSPLLWSVSTNPELLAFSIENHSHRQLLALNKSKLKMEWRDQVNWRQIIYDKKSFEIAPPHFDNQFKTTVLPVRFEVNGHGLPHYLVTILVDIGYFENALLKWHFGDDTTVTMATIGGTIILPPTFPPDRPLAIEKLRLHQSGRSSYIELVTHKDGHAFYLSYTRSTFLKWGIFVERQTTIASDLVRRLRIIFIIFIAGTLLISLLGSFWIVGKIVGPIEALDAGIKLMENGLLVEPLPVTSKDEIARLTMSFNEMMQTLNVREEEIKSQNNKLAFLNDITRTINQTSNLSDILSLVMKKTIAQLQAYSGWVYILDRQGAYLRCMAHDGLLAEPLPEISMTATEHHPLAKVIGSGQVQVFHDQQSLASLFPSMPFPASTEVMLIPLRSQKKVVGLIGIGSRRQSKFKMRDRAWAGKIGDELGIVIENAQLYSELQLRLNELEAVNKDLQELDQFKTRILSNVSHELRTPLTSIKSYVELFLCDKIGPLDSMQKDKLAIIKRNITHLLTLIEDLLVLSKLQDQKKHLKNMEVANLQELVDEVIAATEEMAKAKGLTLQRAGTTQSIMVRINRSKIVQVMQNLVSNAIKFTEQGSITIRLTLSTPESTPSSTVPMVKLEVADTGIGIPKKSLPKIFHRFYQIDSSSTRKYVGTGLGLSIVKEILDAHQSKIHVASEENRGSTFSFELPVVNQVTV